MQAKTVQDLLDAGFLDSDYVSSSDTEESQSSDMASSAVKSEKSETVNSVATTSERYENAVCSPMEHTQHSNRYLSDGPFQRANRLLSHRTHQIRDRVTRELAASRRGIDSSHFHRSSFSLRTRDIGHVSPSRGSRSMANLQYIPPLQSTSTVSDRNQMINVGPQQAQRSNSMPNLMNGAYPTPLYSRSFCQLPPMTTIMRHFLRL